MTIGFIQEHIPERMAELGFGKGYFTRMRTIAVAKWEEVVIPAFNQWLFFPSDLQSSNPGLKIESNFGLLNLGNPELFEQQFEHTGKVTISNKSPQDERVSFLVAVPLPNH